MSKIVQMRCAMMRSMRERKARQGKLTWVAMIFSVHCWFVIWSLWIPRVQHVIADPMGNSNWNYYLIQNWNERGHYWNVELDSSGWVEVLIRSDEPLKARAHLSTNESGRCASDVPRFPSQPPGQRTLVTFTYTVIFPVPRITIGSNLGSRCTTVSSSSWTSS